MNVILVFHDLFNCRMPMNIFLAAEILEVDTYVHSLVCLHKEPNESPLSCFLVFVTFS